MHKITRVATAAAVIAAVLGLSACAPSAPIDLAKAKIYQAAEAIRGLDGATIAKAACDDAAEISWAVLSPEKADKYGVKVPVEVAVGQVREGAESPLAAYAEEFGGDLFVAELTIPAFASGSESAATPDVLVTVRDGEACLIEIGS